MNVKKLLSKANTPAKRKALLAVPLLLALGFFKAYKDMGHFYFNFNWQDLGFLAFTLFTLALACAVWALTPLDRWLKGAPEEKPPLERR
jgi:hypothetical protein